MKGFFPHYFTHPSKRGYRGRYPAPLLYGADQMSVEDRADFLRWYEGVKDKTFVFNEQLEKYCQNDVEILAEGFKNFRSEFIKTTGVDPIKSVTIAGAALNVFQTNFLPREKIAILNNRTSRYQPKTFSNVSIQWLEYIAKTRGIFIQHALNIGEKQFGPYYVDGYSDSQGKQRIFSFNGCVFHGCEVCFNPGDPSPFDGTPFGQLYSKTLERRTKIESKYHIEIEEMWEHEWTRMKKYDPSVKSFMSNYELKPRLEPRAALFGGRTSAVRLRYTAQPGESMHYVDFTSLYPYCNAEFFLPL